MRGHDRSLPGALIGKTCKECARQYNKSDEIREYYAQRTKEYERRNYLWSNYRITLEEYDQLLADQNGNCGICGEPPADNNRRRNLFIDHDHDCCPGKKSCGKCIRGLLCHRCNLALGNLRDDLILLYNAGEYLKKAMA